MDISKIIKQQEERLNSSHMSRDKLMADLAYQLTKTDKSENSSIQILNDELNEITSTIQTLTRAIAQLSLVTDTSSDTHSSVQVGATITFEDIDTKESYKMVVLPIDTFLSENILSTESEIYLNAKGKYINDSFSVFVEDTFTNYKILNIE